MAKEIILYNLKPEITDEEYAEYVRSFKGPFIESQPGAKKFTLVEISGSAKGVIPYKYVGIVDVTSLDEWKKTMAGEPFQNFIKEWSQKVSEFHILFGEDVPF
jgi:hypothetical protein